METGEGSAFEVSENDSVHPHVSDMLEIVSSETKGQGLLLGKQILSLFKVAQFPWIGTFPDHTLAT